MISGKGAAEEEGTHPWQGSSGSGAEAFEQAGDGPHASPPFCVWAREPRWVTLAFARLHGHVGPLRAAATAVTGPVLCQCRLPRPTASTEHRGMPSSSTRLCVCAQCKNGSCSSPHRTAPIAPPPFRSVAKHLKRWEGHPTCAATEHHFAPSTSASPHMCPAAVAVNWPACLLAHNAPHVATPVQHHEEHVRMMMATGARSRALPPPHRHPLYPTLARVTSSSVLMHARR